MATGNTGVFMNINGTVHAVVNWRSRQDKDDVIVGCRLSDNQRRLYEKMKTQGFTDAVIVDRLYPQAVLPKASVKVSIDVALLTKAQLVQLIRERLNKPMPTLEKLNTEDLRSILASCAG
jgi:hypothetical protein